MIIEIGYTYQYDKHSPVETSWTYFYVKGDDLEKAKTKAKTYWKKFVTELGWIKKAKLTHIEAIQHGIKNYTPQHIIVNNAELPPARKRRSTQQKAPPRSPRTSSPSPPKTKNKKGV